jgi:hypothetical protein
LLHLSFFSLSTALAQPNQCPRPAPQRSSRKSNPRSAGKAALAHAKTNQTSTHLIDERWMPVTPDQHLEIPLVSRKRNTASNMTKPEHVQRNQPKLHPTCGCTQHETGKSQYPQPPTDTAAARRGPRKASPPCGGGKPCCGGPKKKKDYNKVFDGSEE